MKGTPPLWAGATIAAVVLAPWQAAAESITLDEKSVAADALRWLDIEGVAYLESFRSSFSYGSSGSVVVDWTDGETVFSGTLTATTLKPNFAYQIKLVGRASITSATEAPDPDTAPEAWASWQLGSHGRWWDEDDQWNLNDSQLASALAGNHSVVGYLLMDFFVTDSSGNATKSFTLDSTYHVLWRTDQRTRTSADSAVVYRDISRGLWGYGNSPAADGNTVGIFAEGESGRDAPGTLVMPDGVYPVTLNITEESFHDNMTYPDPIPIEHGGFWAQVLEKDFSFEVWPLAVRWPR